MSNTFAYDLFEYPSQVIPQMHPAKLAAIGRLHGIRTAPPRACRLLEVGCGDGLHLLSLALAYPNSKFVGVDMSRNAIDRGNALLQKLGLKNLELIEADLLTWNPGPEPFDYITAHGFFSWVPESVRARLLALCNETMTEAGIAYISYNALPGCQIRQMLAEMMKLHIGDTSDPVERVSKATEFMMWLGNDTLDRGTYGKTVRAEAERLLNDSLPAVMFHDDLASINTAFFLTNFAQLISEYDLGFLAEADYSETNVASLPEEARERLSALNGTDPIVNDQHLDFLKGRRFRQSVICRGNHRLGGPIDHNAIFDMDIVGHLRPRHADAGTDEFDGQQDIWRFDSSDGAVLTTDQPVIKAALLEVGNAFPLPRHFASILDHARLAAASESPADSDGPLLAQALYKAFHLGLISLQVDAPIFATVVGDKPLASPLARLNVEMGNDVVASLRPSMVRLDSRPALELLAVLDGTRDRDMVLETLASRMAKYEIPGESEGESIRHDASWWKTQLEPTLEGALQLIANMALLVEPPQCDTLEPIAALPL